MGRQPQDRRHGHRSAHSPAAPIWCAAATISPAAASTSSAARSASRARVPINPILDIVAEGGVQGLNAVIRVTGRGQRPEITFTSTPALPQDELLSPAAVRHLDHQPVGARSVAARRRRGLAERDRRRARSDQCRAQRHRPRSPAHPAGRHHARTRAPSIAAGKYIGRRVYVEVVTDGRGYSATQVEYQITRWLSLLSSISTIGRESVNVRVSKDY